MTENPQTLRSLFSSAKAKRDELDSSYDLDASTVQKRLAEATAAFDECRRLIGQLSLFSSNETLDDVATTDLQYLSVDYLLSELLIKSYGSDREGTLRRVQDAFESFLERLDDYGVLSLADKKLYKQYTENSGSFSLASVNDATERRRVKVARFQEEKALKQKLAYLRENENILQTDDSQLRELYLTELKFYTHQTFQSFDIISQELAMLSHARQAPSSQEPQPEDGRKRNGADKDGYSEKLDPPLAELLRGGKAGPLLSKNGKPLQPFTLTDQRTQLRQDVFRPDHSLPTMTIKEYLEEERRRGGMVESGGEASGQPQQIDEDNIDLADAETMKAREWDEFKEQNPKGSGNTLNRG